MFNSKINKQSHPYGIIKLRKNWLNDPVQRDPINAADVILRLKLF